MLHNHGCKVRGDENLHLKGFVADMDAEVRINALFDPKVLRKRELFIKVFEFPNARKAENENFLPEFIKGEQVPAVAVMNKPVGMDGPHSRLSVPDGGVGDADFPPVHSGCVDIDPYLGVEGD
jgi:hypothetical protein